VTTLYLIESHLKEEKIMGKSLLGKYEIALEAIAFQSTHFGKLLENIFQEIKDTGVSDPTELTKLGFDRVILKAIEDHTNLIIPKLEFLDKTIVNANVEYRIDYAKHILNHSFIKNINLKSDDAEKILQRLQAAKEETYVDLRTGKVYGVFKEIGQVVRLGLGLIYEPELTPAKATAALLHEIGHVITYCEYFDRFSTTNQVVAALARSVEKDPPEKRKIAFTTAEKILKLRDGAFGGIEQSDNVASISTIVIDAALREQPLLESTQYDQTSFEQLADNYVVRCGYGRQLIELLDHLPNKRSYSQANVGGRTGAAIAGVALMQTLYIFGGGLLTVLTGGAGAVFTYAMVSIVLGGVTNYDYTYDSLKVRMKRAKEQMIENLKNSELPPQSQKEVITELERVDKIITKTPELKTGIFDKVSNYLMSKNRTLKEKIELQRELEELAHNDLYVAAAKLRNF
jgi:hypothetical protein